MWDLCPLSFEVRKGQWSSTGVEQTSSDLVASLMMPRASFLPAMAASGLQLQLQGVWAGEPTSWTHQQGGPFGFV